MTSFLDKNGLEYYNSKINTKLGNKQDTLVSGTNIKTVNNQSVLGSGDITISGGAECESFIQGSGNYYGSSSNPIPLDDKKAGGKYIYHNNNGTTAVYYTYTQRNASTTTRGKIWFEYVDESLVLLPRDSAFRKVEVEMYTTIEEGVNSPQYTPIARITLYPNSSYYTIKNMDSYAGACEYLLYSDGSGGISTRYMYGVCSAQWTGTVIGQTNARVTALETQVGNIDTALATIINGSGV